MISSNNLIFFVLFIFKPMLGIENWKNIDKPVKTVYYQGMMNSQVQASRYTGTRGFLATTDEYVICPKNSIDIIHDISLAPEIDEVELDTTFSGIGKRNNNNLLSTLKLYPWYYAQYIKGYLVNCWYGVKIEKQVRSKESKETVKGHAIRLSKVNIGQEGDVASHIKKVEFCGNCDKILFGVSRGTAATFVSYAQNKYPNVRLVVLEGAIDSINNVLAGYWFGKEYTKILETIGTFKSDGISPLDLVDDFPKKTPIAFITSTKDKEVPASCTKNIAQALSNSGHEEVYLCELKKSSHIGYVMDDKEDALAYTIFMHTLYKYYNLPYIEVFATGNVEDYRVNKKI